jgi:hypothetical protein
MIRIQPRLASLQPREGRDVIGTQVRLESPWTVGGGRSWVN